MASNMVSSFSLLLVVLLAGCYCAPGRVAGGFNVGGHSELDLTAGGMGHIDRDGLAFTGTGNGVFGAKWKGRAYGGGYGAFNDNYFGGRAAGDATLGGYLRPRVQGAIGIDSKWNMPIGLLPGLGVEKMADARGNFELSNGDDAKHLAALYGDFHANEASIN